MKQQPLVPSSGLMPANDVLIRAKEVNLNSVVALPQIKLEYRI